MSILTENSHESIYFFLMNKKCNRNKFKKTGSRVYFIEVFNSNINEALDATCFT